ncbi:Stk1 family PASTA domain-containing Ser/Thr kinase [Vagococcus coleopterorum]|uniref:non-specific serine/threonine protein kinase n=1 Tax=Vagococcus coleopterorum TaxID=2714946 RepID=A0A6G8AM34_9ENTE|nr:Stk1 family PASTA domain-containing Ser/Thr kinase [Vagococcus coleopterorum]QIL46144.1 Stk1 family PASTA domain-containing Ser/Thr kinase [Vagococcus coleopterorum]
MVKVGHKINDRYKVIGNVGSGGMANVFLAEDLILEREVAVKMLRFDFQNDQIAIRRFQREALAASELVHPNIVGVYDVGEEDGMQYLVMEYVKGTDLKQYIKKNHPLSIETVVRIMEQVLSGVSLAHKHHIIHRDLKPQNILMDEAGNVKIADFGIAVALSETSLTQTNTLLGSVHYLSPEQARGGMATRQSDIYALGIILYELLTGRVPFDGESAVSIALKHFQSEVPSVRAMNVSIPQALENVILHAAAKDPKDRYLTANDMELDISTALDSARRDEPVFVPKHLSMDETKVLSPITESDIPESFRHMSAEKEEKVVTSKKTPVVEEEEEPKKKRKWPWILLLLILAGVGLGYLGLSGNKPIKMPDLKDKTVSEARRELTALGLKVDEDIVEVPDEEIEAGNVVRTIPKAGVEVKKGREIKLYISSGTKKIMLKDYENKKYDDVYEELIALGFGDKQIVKKKEGSEDVEEGYIISQSPKDGKEVDPSEDEIELVVSTGSELVKLDDYVGMSYEAAYDQLIALGFSGSQILRNDETSDEVEAGVVMKSTPGSQASVNPNKDTVELTVSKGAKSFGLRNMEGYTKAQAHKYLEDKGLIAKEAPSEYSDTVPFGSVISHTPDGGTELYKGDSVTLVISKGPEPKEETEATEKEEALDTEVNPFG